MFSFPSSFLACLLLSRPVPFCEHRLLLQCKQFPQCEPSPTEGFVTTRIYVFSLFALALPASSTCHQGGPAVEMWGRGPDTHCL